jgi:hypothetical protein
MPHGAPGFLRQGGVTFQGVWGGGRKRTRSSAANRKIRDPGKAPRRRRDAAQTHAQKASVGHPESQNPHPSRNTLRVPFRCASGQAAPGNSGAKCRRDALRHAQGRPALQDRAALPVESTETDKPCRAEDRGDCVSARLGTASSASTDGACRDQRQPRESGDSRSQRARVRGGGWRGLRRRASAETGGGSGR